MIRSAGPDPSPRGPDPSLGVLIRPEGPGLPRGALLCPTGSNLSRGALVRSRGSQICPAGPVLGRIRALSAWAQSQGWHMDPLGPQSEQYWSIGPQSEGPETFSSFRAPQDRSGSHRTDQRPAERIRVPQQEPGLQRTNQGSIGRIRVRRTQKDPTDIRAPRD